MTITYEKIATNTLLTPTASVTFNSFSGYTDLVLVINGKMTSTGNSIYLRCNDDSTTPNYTTLIGNNADIQGTTAFGSGLGGYAVGYTATQFMIEANIFNYANTANPKAITSRWVQGGDQTEIIANTYDSNSAITELKILINAADTFQSGTTFTLYGILRA
jgi:hypothetical protein